VALVRLLLVPAAVVSLATAAGAASKARISYYAGTGVGCCAWIFNTRPTSPQGSTNTTRKSCGTWYATDTFPNNT
jgi:hypothetical protein